MKPLTVAQLRCGRCGKLEEMDGVREHAYLLPYSQWTTFNEKAVYGFVYCTNCLGLKEK